MKEEGKKPKILLVVECQSQLNWYEIFQNATLLDGTPIEIEQATWDEMSVISYDSPGVMVQFNRARKPHPGTSQERERMKQIDFVLLRSVTRSIKGQDSLNKLLGLIHGGLPSVNSLASAYLCKDRPVVFGELRKIQKKLGVDFPLIPQTLFTEHRTMLMTPDYPFVAKVAHVHAGYGKLKVENSTQFQDLRGLIAIHDDYVSVEQFIEWDYDLRIQKIGPHYRGFKRISTNWKGNVGNQSIVSDMEVSDKHKLMIDECSKIFGGLDICALDLLHSKSNDREYILELNDTAIGLVHEHEYDDMCTIRDLVIYRMSNHFMKKLEEEEPKIDDETSKILQEQINVLHVELNSLQTRNLSLNNRRRDVENEGEEKKQTLVWFQSVIIIVLLSILFALLMRPNPNDALL